MNTDDLIAALSREPDTADGRSLNRRMIIALVAGGAAALLLLQLTLGIRADLGVSLGMVAAKAAFCALLTVLAGGAAMRLARPGASRRALLQLPLVVIAGFAMAAVSLAGAAPSDRLALLMGTRFPLCVIVIPLLAAPVAALIAWAWREAAPTDLAAAGAAVGALAGGVGAVVYSLYCPIDSVAFVTVWYAVGIGAAAGLGALLGPRLLQW